MFVKESFSWRDEHYFVQRIWSQTASTCAINASGHMLEFLCSRHLNKVAELNINMLLENYDGEDKIYTLLRNFKRDKAWSLESVSGENAKALQEFNFNYQKRDFDAPDLCNGLIEQFA